MAGEALPRSLKDATITITDTDGAHELEITCERGEFGYEAVGIPYAHVPDRGSFGSIIPAEDQPIRCTLSGVYMREFTSGSGETLPRVIAGKGTSWVYTAVTVSSGDYNGKTASHLAAVAATVPVVQVRIAFANPAGGGAETMNLLDCLTDGHGFAEGGPADPNKFSWTFSCFRRFGTLMDDITS